MPLDPVGASRCVMTGRRPGLPGGNGAAECMNGSLRTPELVPATSAEWSPCVSILLHLAAIGLSLALE